MTWTFSLFPRQKSIVHSKGFSKPYQKDRTLGGGLLMYVNENIPSRTLHEHSIPDDIEIMCVEINLRKQKWVLLGI